MLLCVDIGNSNIVLGLYEGNTLTDTWRLRTDPLKTADEYAVLVWGLFSLHNLAPSSLTGAILSSVVPPLSPVWLRVISLLNANIEILQVGAGIKTGLNIKIDDPGELGADLAATAVGALTKYPLPAIVVDLGTATKITVVDRDRSFIGGCLMPGVLIGLNALSSKTAQLPAVNLQPQSLNPIGSNTVDCMQAGSIFGTASMIDGMIRRYKREVGADASVIACGGLASTIVPFCEESIHLDPHLLLDGLKALYEKNTKIV